MGKVLRTLAAGPTTKDRIELVCLGDDDATAVTRVRVSWQGRQFDLHETAFLGFSETMEAAARSFRAIQVRTVDETFALLDRERLVYAMLDAGDCRGGPAERAPWTILVHGDHLDHLLRVLDARPSIRQTRGISIELDVQTDAGVAPQRVVVLTPELGTFPGDFATRVLGRRVRGNGAWWPHPADARLLWAYHIVCVRGTVIAGDRARLDWLAKRGGDAAPPRGDCTEIAVSMLREAAIDLSSVTPISSPPFARPASDLVASHGVEGEHGLSVDRLFADPQSNVFVRQVSRSAARAMFRLLESLDGEWFPDVRHYEEDAMTGWFEIDRKVGPRVCDAESVIRTWTFDEAKSCVSGILEMTAAVVRAEGSASLIHAESIQLHHGRPILHAAAIPAVGEPTSGSAVRRMIESSFVPFFPELLTIAKLIGKDPVSWSTLAEKAASLSPRKADNDRAQALRLAALGRYGEATEIFPTLDETDRARTDVRFWRSHIALWAGERREAHPVDVTVDALPPSIRRSDVIAARVIDETISCTGVAPLWCDAVVRTHLERDASDALVDVLARHASVLPNLVASEVAEQAFRRAERVDGWFEIVADLLVRESAGERIGLEASLQQRSGALLREVEHVSAISALAQLSHLNGETEQALSLARAVLARDPYDLGCARVLARAGGDPARWWRHVARLSPHDAEARERQRELGWAGMVPPIDDEAPDVSELSPRDVWEEVSAAVRAKEPHRAHVYARALLERAPELSEALTPLVDQLRYWDGASRRAAVTARVSLARSTTPAADRMPPAGALEEEAA